MAPKLSICLTLILTFANSAPALAGKLRNAKEEATEEISISLKGLFDEMKMRNPASYDDLWNTRSTSCVAKEIEAKVRASLDRDPKYKTATTDLKRDLWRKKLQEVFDNLAMENEEEPVLHKSLKRWGQVAIEWSELRERIGQPTEIVGQVAVNRLQSGTDQALSQYPSILEPDFDKRVVEIRRKERQEAALAVRRSEERVSEATQRLIQAERRVQEFTKLDALLKTKIPPTGTGPDGHLSPKSEDEKEVLKTLRSLLDEMVSTDRVGDSNGDVFYEVHKVDHYLDSPHDQAITVLRVVELALSAKAAEESERLAIAIEELKGKAPGSLKKSAEELTATNSRVVDLKLILGRAHSSSKIAGIQAQLRTQYQVRKELWNEVVDGIKKAGVMKEVAELSTAKETE